MDNDSLRVPTIGCEFILYNLQALPGSKVYYYSTDRKGDICLNALWDSEKLLDIALSLFYYSLWW